MSAVKNVYLDVRCTTLDESFEIRTKNVKTFNINECYLYNYMNWS